MVTFWSNFRKIWLLFNLLPGHTDQKVFEFRSQNGSVGGSPSGSVYGSHEASYNGSTNVSHGYPSDDEDDDDDNGDAFEEMSDALNEMDTREVASNAASTSKASGGAGDSPPLRRRKSAS